MKKTLALILSLALPLFLPACGNGSLSEREKAVESEVLAIRAENEAKAESLSNAEDPVRTDGVGEDAEDAGGADAASSAGDADSAEAAVKTPPKNDWDGILSSEYQTVGNKYYFRMVTLMRHRNSHGGYSVGTVSLFHWLDLATGDYGPICPDPLCAHDDGAVCKYLEVSFQADNLFVDENTMLASRDVNPNRAPQLCLFDLKNDTMRSLYQAKMFSADLMGTDGDSVWIVDEVQKTVKKQAVYITTLYRVSLDAGEILYERVLPENCRPFLWRDGLLWCDNVKSLTLTDPDTWEETVILNYESDDQIGAWYYDTYRDEFWFSIINPRKTTGRLYRYSAADGVCEEIPMPVDEIYYFQLTNTKIYYSPYDPVYIGPNYMGGLWDYAGRTIYTVSRDDTAGEPVAVYTETEDRFLCRAGVFGYFVFGDTLLMDSNQIVSRLETTPEGENVWEWAIDQAGDVHKIRVNLKTGERDEILFGD